MRLRAVTLVVLLFCSVLPAAQTPAPTPPQGRTRARDAADRASSCKTGVGYFEHLGNVEPAGRHGAVTSGQPNDVLGSPPP